MRVAMVTANYRPLLGGIETHVFEVGRRLASRIDLSVLTTDLTGRLPPEEEHDAVLVRRFKAVPRGRDYYFSPQLLRTIGRGHFDLVHVQGVHTLLPPMALGTARRAGVPAILTFHTGGSSRRLRRVACDLQWRGEGPILRHAQTLVAVCEFEVRYFSGLLGLDPAHFRLIRNGSDPLPADTAPGGLPGDPLICSVGRLERYKGHHRAIAAMPAVRAEAPGARLAVVGTGPYEASLRRLVTELGLEDVVSFQSFGADQRAGLGALIGASDLVVLLSDYEAHPVAVMEALALGKDVLVADTSGLSELGRAGLAHVVDPQASPAALAGAMAEAMAARTWRDGPPALPSWDDCAAEILTCYEEVLACAS